MSTILNRDYSCIKHSKHFSLNIKSRSEYKICTFPILKENERSCVTRHFVSHSFKVSFWYVIYNWLPVEIFLWCTNVLIDSCYDKNSE